MLPKKYKSLIKYGSIILTVLLILTAAEFYRAPLTAALKHEQYVTSLIHAIYKQARDSDDFRACQFLRGQQAGKQNPGIGKPYPGNNKQLFPIRTARGNPFTCPGFFGRSSCSRARTRTTPGANAETSPGTQTRISTRAGT